MDRIAMPHLCKLSDDPKPLGGAKILVTPRPQMIFWDE